MADNQYVNKVEYEGQTLIDITDTTAEPSNVAAGEVFYNAAGARSVGTMSAVTGNTRVFFGTCDTAADTRAKAVTIAGYDAYTAGDVVYVTFAEAQDYSGGPYLNINSLGNKGIRRSVASNGYNYMWQAGETVQFVYSGTYFMAVKSMTATKYYYGVTKLIESVTSTSASTVPTASAINNYSERMITGLPLYSSDSPYAVGDRVRHDWYSYECIVAISEKESWNAEHWKQLPALQTQIDAIPHNAKHFSKESATTHVISIPNGGFHFIIAMTNNLNNYWVGLATCASNGTVNIVEITKGSNTTVSTSTNSISINIGTTARVLFVQDFLMNYSGDDTMFVS